MNGCPNLKKMTLKKMICDQNIELLAVSCRPYYLPREFSHVIVQVVYIPPSGNGGLVTETISRVTYDMQRSSPESLFIINGDFNHSSLSVTLPSFKQMGTCPMSEGKIIDLFYTNVKDSYSAKRLTTLGQLDHNLISMARSRSRYSPVI